MRARAGLGGARTRPCRAGCAISTPPNRKSNFQRPAGILIRALDPNPSQSWGRGRSAFLHPNSLPRLRTRGPLTAPSGLPVQPRVQGASAARSPWGERETEQTVGARSLAASSAENRGRRVPSCGGGPKEAGAESAQLPSPALRGLRNAGCEQPMRAALGRSRGRRCPVPGHQLLSRRPGPGSRRPRGSAPLIPLACFPEKELREASAGGGAAGVGGPRCVPGGGGNR